MRKQVGACLVRDHRIISLGVNGSPSKMPHCSDVGCQIEDEHCVRCIHAEMNAILQCAIHGISPVGSTLYCTYTPCFECAKVLIQAGITKIVFEKVYDQKVCAYLRSSILLEKIDDLTSEKTSLRELQYG